MCGHDLSTFVKGRVWDTTSWLAKNDNKGEVFIIIRGTQYVFEYGKVGQHIDTHVLVKRFYICVGGVPR